jgi:hypothetical protein
MALPPHRRSDDLPDGPETAGRDASFADLYSDLAWIHSHDAHADHAKRHPAVSAADVRAGRATEAQLPAIQ